MSNPDVKLTIPLLAAASGAGHGLPYSLWRPQMQTFLMRAGIEKRDYEEKIEKWEQLCKAVETDARAEEEDDLQLLLGGGGGGDSSVKKEPIDEARVKAKKRVAERVSRTRKAYGYLHAALPADLRQLVAGVPQGYAFGVWSFLEKKFRNTEQDSVMALWKKFTTLQQQQEESFDAYKARVDAARELLVHAKQTLSPGLYASLLLWNLQPRYAAAVLALQTADKLKDPAAVDWAHITDYMAQYERTQRHTEGNSAEDGGQRTMAVLAGMPNQQSRSPVGSNKKPAQNLSKVDCYYCKKLGHYASDCPVLKEKEMRQQKKAQPWKNAPKAKKGKGAGERSRSQSPASKETDDSSGSETEGRPARSGTPKPRGGAGSGMRAVRVHSKYAALLAAGPDSESESDSEEDIGSNDGLQQTRGSARLQLASILRRPGGTSAWSPKSVKFEKPAGGAQHHPQREDGLQLRTLLRTAKAVDTGAQVGATGNKDLLINLRPCAPMPLLMANQSIVVATLIGDMPLSLQSADERHPKVCTEIVKDVYYHEKIEANLLSWDKMRCTGWELHSTKAGTDLVTPAGQRVKASTRGGLTLLEETEPSQLYAMRMGKVICSTAKELVLLHQRTGHASWGRLLQMCKAGTTVGVGDISAMPASELENAESRIKTCTACTQGKQRKKAVGHQGLERGTEKGEVLHMDTFHVTRRDRHTGEKVREYGLLAVDSFTEVHWLAPSLRYRDVQDEAVTILRESHTLNGRHPRLVVADLGKEFDNAVVREYCAKHGIKYQPTPRGAKELNGLSERHVGTVKDHTRTMLLASGVPNHIGWMRAATHHVYLWNRTHLCKATGLTPYETVTGRKPSLLNVGVFGCDAFIHQDRDQRDDTFSPKAEPGVYLGHDWAQNCPVVRMVHSGKIVQAKDVVFREGSFEHIRAEKEGRTKNIRSLSLDDVAGEDSGSEPVVESDDAKSAESAADSEPDSNSDSEEEAVAAYSTKYTVKAITSHRTSADGSKEYQVKWVGYRATTWEPARIIQEDAPRVAQAYEQFLEGRSKARVTRSQTSLRSAAVATQPEAAAAPAAGSSDSSPASGGNSGEEKEDISDVMAARDDAAQRL
jgi:hypothetical protein